MKILYFYLNATKHCGFPFEHRKTKHVLHSHLDSGYTVPACHSEVANAHSCLHARLVLFVKAMKHRGFFFNSLCIRKNVGRIGLDLLSLK